MRLTRILLTFAAATLVLSSGCTGPERKLGRGINNFTEPLRMGEIRRSMEQASLWDNQDSAYTTGFFKGFNRTIARTAVGFYEIVTFPFPGYEPYYFPEHPVYPDNYKPSLLSDSTFETDSAMGFSGGDIAPWLPGSKFRVFDR